MDRKYFVWGGVLLALVLVLGMLFPRPGPSVVERVIEKLGAIPGTSVDSEIFSIGGLQFAFIQRPLQATSSVICAIRNPFAPATTSIDYFSVKNDKAFAGAIVYTISTSTSQFGSSTRALAFELDPAAGAQFHHIWIPRHATSSVSASGWANTLFQKFDDKASPFFLTGTQWLTARISTGTPGGLETPSGFCNFRGTKL